MNAAQNFNDIDNPVLRHEIRAVDPPKETPDKEIMAFYEVIDCVNDFIKKNKSDPGIEKYKRFLWAANEMLDMLASKGELSIDTEFRLGV